MNLTKFIRLLHVRNVINVNNVREAGGTINIKRLLNVTSKSYNTVNNEVEYALEDSFPNTSNKKLTKAMNAYLQQARDYKEFLKREAMSYDLGKRHLANMMGVEIDDLTDSYIAKSIEYLFPSGLYDWRARPMMAHPQKIFSKKKEAEFSETGRPHHFLFYTCNPVYYGILYNIADSIQFLNKMEDQEIAKKKLPSTDDKFNPLGSEWFTQKQLESKIMEKIKTEQYEYLIKSFDKLMQHPLSNHKSDFLMQYRSTLRRITQNIKLPSLQYDSNNRPFVVVECCMRKNSRGQVKMLGNGSGNITINGKDISYFQDIQCREQGVRPSLGKILMGDSRGQNKTKIKNTNLLMEAS